MDDLEIIPKVITKEVVVKEEINMDSVANYLIVKDLNIVFQQTVK
jgi:hypothetical protein